MNVDLNRKLSSTLATRTRLLRAGTALPLLLAAWPALAEPIVENSSTDISVEADSASGTPVAVDLATDGGSITVSVDAVTATAEAGVRGNVVDLRTADGAIEASLGSITATGEGAIIGLGAESASGNIDVNVAEITLDGAITSGVQARSLSGNVTVQGDAVLLRGTGGDPDNGFFPEGLLASSDEGAATVIGGTVDVRGLYGSAAIAVAGTDARVVVETARATSDGAVAVAAHGFGSALVEAGSVVLTGDGAGVEAVSDGGTATAQIGSVSSGGSAVYARGATGVSVTAGTVEAARYGVYAQSGDGPIDLTVTGSASTSGNTSSAITAITTGDITIDAANVVVTGPGDFPGARADGYRFERGGIVALGEGGNGAIAINAGTVEVEGEHRYGIATRGNGPITIVADEVTLASADSVAVVARAGEGDVSITTGTVTTTGVSGTAVYADTTSGNIAIDAGITRAEAAGQVGWFAAEAVAATSQTGSISIRSADAFTAGEGGSAISAFTDGDVTIESGLASTSGDLGVAVFGVSYASDLSISADEIRTSGADTTALLASAVAGTTTIDVDRITATGANAEGLRARVGTGGVTMDIGSVSSTGNGVTLTSNATGAGAATINIGGDIASDARGIDIVTGSNDTVPNSLWTTINVAEGASVTGATAIGLSSTYNNGQPLPSYQRSGIAVVNNEGTITGTAGTALDLGQTNVTLTNTGTIVGNVVSGGGMIQNRGGTIDGSVALDAFAGSPMSIFAYLGESTGVTGTITGGGAIDTLGQIFDADGTAVIGGGLPTAFERYGVISDGDSDATVVVETAAAPVGATPALLLYGNASIVNRADLNGAVVPGLAGIPQEMAAVTSYGFTTVHRDGLGFGFMFDGSGQGPASFTNEAEITGQVSLSTSEFVNSGTITRSSAGLLSIVTARIGEAFSFTNTGTIRMIDEGNRQRNDIQGFPFNDINPYHLPEPAMTIRSAVAGTLDGEGIFVPATITNSGTIDGGLLARMTASEFTFDNSGTIAGFNGASRTERGLTILLGRNYDGAVGDRNWFDPAPTLASEIATLTNSGEITDGVYAHLIADVVEFGNSGSISGSDAEPGALFVEQSLENDTDATSFAFVNTGEIAGNGQFELEVSTVEISNGGTITGAGYAVNAATFGEIVFGGQAALEIDNETNGDNTLTFTNTGSVATAAHAASGVTIESEAGDDDLADGEVELSGDTRVAVVNSGTISATGGATLVTQQYATWLQPGQLLVNPMAALAVDASDANGESVIAIDNREGGVIRAGGTLQVATPGGYVPSTDAPANLYTAAVYATGKTIEITNSGRIEGGRGSTLQPYMVMDDLEFHETFLGGAIQTAGAEYEVGDDEIYIASADRVTNTATGVIVGSINLGGNDDVLHNAGRIEGFVYLGTGDDVLELAESSIIDDIVDLGDGDDRVILAFGEGVSTGTGQVATTVNAEGLVAQSGHWRAEGVQSEYDFVTIAEGASLTVVENDDGELAVATDTVELDGALRLDLSVDETEADLGETTITGTGSLHLVGTATVELADATGLQHTGGTFVENGELMLTTVYGGDITTSDDGVFVLALGGDLTGNLVNNGTFRFDQEGDYDFLGDFSGSGLLEKRGAGVLSFAGLYDFDGTTTIQGGSVIFTGQLAEDAELDLDDGVLDLSNIQSGQQTIAQLGGTGGTLQLGETELIIDQMTDTVFSGEILGLGTLLKEGDGDLKLNGDGTGFTGTGQVGGGTLSVNGNFGNANFVVDPGGKLGGAGTVGSTNVNGGTLAPGNSIDTLTVNGDVTFTAASVYEVEVDAAGNSDLLQATGIATLGGAQVNVIAENAVYRPQTDYTILTAAGGVSGTFGSVETNLAFLDPTLSYSANAVTLRLVRNDIDFAAFGATPNQAAVGGLIESLGVGNVLYEETLTLADSNVSVSFGSLTGAIYPAYGAAVIETAEILRRQTAAAANGGEGAFAWATGLYNSVDSGRGEGNIELLGKGAVGGFGFGAGGLSATAGIGKLDQDRGGSQFSDGEVTFAIGQLAWNGMGGLSVSAGAQFGWVEAETRRQTTLGTINQAVTGQVDGDYVQIFGDLAYALPVGGGFVAEPFVGLSHVSLDLDGVTEAGAPTALAVAAIDRDVTFADIGLRISSAADTGVRPFASAAYRHAWGDRASVSSFGFAGFAGTRLVGAVPIARSAADLSAGIVVTRGMIDFEVGYDATISKAFDSHGVNAGFKVRF